MLKKELLTILFNPNDTYNILKIGFANSKFHYLIYKDDNLYRTFEIVYSNYEIIINELVDNRVSRTQVLNDEEAYNFIELIYTIKQSYTG